MLSRLKAIWYYVGGVRSRKGQATVEYILMLSSVMVILAAFLTTFHKDIVKWFFMFIGEMITPNG